MSRDVIEYSKLFAKLVDQNDDTKLDDVIAAFLYYMFPRELFIRAISLLESSDMFIYILDKLHEEENKVSRSLVDMLIDEFYTDSLDSPLEYRLIVKDTNDGAPPILVDIAHWFCSCEEYCKHLHETLEKTDEKEELHDLLINEVDDHLQFSDDKFAQLDPHSLCKQWYFKFDKICCSHLLAFSILLKSSITVLRFFTDSSNKVFVISIDDIDEWLNLHINIVE
ncbi:Shu2p [Saccharomyces cerevisiae x Saccharomyces kudriavzevii VIN7]|uniref:Shu2p n=1 Tax=Saccharomyces cerevisiae x Saccharomyces kudriavzevii (strain VIN7) TaxID=1095631 RepID=H0GSN8_SACCK|nr:Shu2p [Saccharomyces cerevisiae x Saccharomyces kudriavzevii VIN7]